MISSVVISGNAEASASAASCVAVPSVCVVDASACVPLSVVCAGAAELPHPVSIPVTREAAIIILTTFFFISFPP